MKKMEHSLQDAQPASQISTIETVPFRLILTRNKNSEIFLLKQGGFCRLPEIVIPRKQRVAPHLNATVREKWGMVTVCLFNPQVGIIHAHEPRSHYQVLEAVNSSCCAPNGAVWVPSSSLKDLVFQRDMDRATLWSAISQAHAHDRDNSICTFAGSGWFDELMGWIQNHLDIHGLKLTNNWTQYNIGPSFCLIRCETSGTAVWFKAVGNPNLREYAITMKVAQLCPAYLPKIIATHAGWHGWLALEAIGQHLDNVRDLQCWSNTAISLASLQLETTASSDALLAAGCIDLRLARLYELIEPFLHTVDQLMAVQSATYPPILTLSDLEGMQRKLKFACRELQALGFPDTLGQTDLNPGNVIASVDQSVFIDWAQANVSHPFFSFEYLLALLKRLHPDCESWSSYITEAYSRPWRQTYSTELVTRALQLTPMVAAFAFAVASPGWQDGTSGLELSLAKLLRAIARRIHREAQRIEMVGSQWE
jgi:hypothetical protein